MYIQSTTFRIRVLFKVETKLNEQRKNEGKNKGQNSKSHEIKYNVWKEYRKGCIINILFEIIFAQIDKNLFILLK